LEKSKNLHGPLILVPSLLITVIICCISPSLLITVIICCISPSLLITVVICCISDILCLSHPCFSRELMFLKEMRISSLFF
ncbi:hypothetical protein ACJX0J_012645, partial [Zea mays]